MTFPHQMSGGMRQRVMIAMALSCNPSLLIADEPTTALDVTIQAQILELMKGLKERLGTAIMLITHDLGVVAEMAENVLVMYAGKVVEYADVKTIFKEPKHPYTIGLMGSIPRLDQSKEKLYVIEGTVPNPFDMPGGCRFHPRCPEAREICKNKEPELTSTKGHQVRCWKYSSEWKGQELMEYSQAKLLEVRGLKIFSHNQAYFVKLGHVKVVDGVDLFIKRGETLV